MKKYQQMPINHVLDYFLNWWKIIRFQECAQIFTVPFGDGLQRAFQFRDWVFEKHGVEIEILNVDNDKIQSETDIQEILEPFSCPILLFSRPSFLSKESLWKATSIQNYMQKHQVGFLMIHEGFPSQLFEGGRNISPILLQNLAKFPLHSKHVVKDFVKSVCNDWQINDAIIDIDEIYNLCGGLLFLTTDYLRGLREFPNQSIDKLCQRETFVKRSGQFWHALPLEYQEAILTKKYSTSILEELNDFAFFTDSNSRTLPTAIEIYAQSLRLQSYKIIQNQVFVNNKDISNGFSKKELSLLAYISERIGQVCSRDDLGEAYWGENWLKDYSDWALDKVISRLREKLINNSVPLQIRTLRGQGYTGYIN